MDSVGFVLAEREREDFPWGPGAALALLLHAAVVAAVLLPSLMHPIRFVPTRTVAVRLVQAGSLRGGAPVTAEPAASSEKPKITKPAEDEAPPPTEKAKLLPSKETKKPPAVAAPPSKTPAKASAPEPGGSRPGEGGAVGMGGNVGIGGATFDQPDFNYSYYIERMLVTIGTNWFKPAMSVATSPVVRFRILRDGTLTDIEVERSSGLTYVDRAAERAVIASSPLAPLPSEFSGDHLGVHLIFE